jgi:hypothetical protein
MARCESCALHRAFRLQHAHQLQMKLAKILFRLVEQGGVLRRQPVPQRVLDTRRPRSVRGPRQPDPEAPRLATRQTRGLGVACALKQIIPGGCW